MAQDLTHWPTGRLLSSAARRVERDWNAHLAAWDLNHASLTVLVLLSQRDHSQRELARSTGVTEQTMSRILTKMERTGYLTRSLHGNDKRRHVISMSPAGVAVMTVAADLGAAEALTTRGLTPAQLAQFREFLVTIIGSLPEPDDAPHPPAPWREPRAEPAGIP